MTFETDSKTFRERLIPVSYSTSRGVWVGPDHRHNTNCGDISDILYLNNEFEDGGFSVTSKWGSYFNIGINPGALTQFKGFAHVEQLDAKHTGLKHSNNDQPKSEPSKPIRIIRDPLRLEGDFGVNRRFFGIDARSFGFFLFLFIGIGLSFWSGNYFCNKRYLFGSAFLGLGLLFGIGGWGILFLGWLL